MMTEAEAAKVTSLTESDGWMDGPRDLRLNGCKGALGFV